MQGHMLRKAVSQSTRSTVAASRSKSVMSVSKSKSAVSVSKSKSAIQRPTSQYQLRQKPSATGRRRPVKRSPLWKHFHESPKCKYFTFAMTLLLLTSAIAMIILYFRRLKKLSEKANAIVAIRKLMIQHNNSFEGKSDAEILAGAQQSAQYLLDWKSQNDEIQHALDSTTEKLTLGWKPFGGHLYYFSTLMLPFAGAKEACKENGSMVTDITSLKEEDFVEEEVSKDYVPYWIGLVYINDNWVWLNNQPLRTHYWQSGRPDDFGKVGEHCVEIQRCSTKRQCWNDVPCKEKKKWICKMKPDPKWL